MLLWIFSALLLGSVIATDEAGLAFLTEKKNQPDVLALPSGLLYKVLKKGDGKFHPGVSTPCSCHYAGTLIDGTEFDSSYGRGQPTTFAPNQVIKGWTEAMQLMVAGDKWELYIPSELAYGESGSPPQIPPNAALVFQMEILEILGPDVVERLVCSIDDESLCNEKEAAYLQKSKDWDASKLKAQLERLNRMLAENEQKPNMGEEQASWARRRVHILQQNVAKDKDEL